MKCIVCDKVAGNWRSVTHFSLLLILKVTL